MPKSVQFYKNTVLVLVVALSILAGVLVWQVISGDPKLNLKTANPQSTDSYIGLAEEVAKGKAEDAGLSFRVIEREGVFLTHTDDLNPNRINVWVDNGRVTKAVRDKDL